MSDDDQYERLRPDESWDAQLAADLVGSSLLVALTFVDHAGVLQRRQQLFGTVLSVSIGAGISLRQANGEIVSIAPLLHAIEPGEPGLYQLADSGELVEDPDFVAHITVTSPPRS